MRADESAFDALMRHKAGGETLDEFISDVANDLNTAKEFAQGGVIDTSDVRDHAKARVRYHKRPAPQFVMADALIDHWMGA